MQIKNLEITLHNTSLPFWLEWTVTYSDNDGDWKVEYRTHREGGLWRRDHYEGDGVYPDWAQEQGSSDWFIGQAPSRERLEAELLKRYRAARNALYN